MVIPFFIVWKLSMFSLIILKSSGLIILLLAFLRFFRLSQATFRRYLRMQVHWLLVTLLSLRCTIRIFFLSPIRKALVQTGSMLIFWDDIGDSLFVAVQFFFNNASLSSSWNKTFITLILKKPNPKLVLDFRPISLCNVCYKIVSKILANRLKPLFPRLISREQSSFLIGRRPFDNIISLQEVTHSLNKDFRHP